jgi:hypothetical protein
MSAKQIGVNDALAIACQKCGSACCKKGQIFLPREEYERIRTHVLTLGSMQVEEFEARTTDHGLFFLYDQKNGCQFLDEHDLCRLHNEGVKPSECFWWPYHIYAGDHPAELELRVFMDCCDGHELDEPDSAYHQAIIERASRIGFDVIRKFRETYCGGDGTTRLIRSLTPPIAQAVVD